MVFGIALAFLFIYQGLRIVSRFVFHSFQWKKSQKWSSTKGLIIQSNLQSMLVPRGGRKSHNIDGSIRLITAYIPDITYEYRVNVESFQSKQLFLGQQFPSTFNKANDFVEQYPIGKKVDVYYDPERPELAVLDKGRFKELLWSLLGGMISILLGFAILIQVINE